MTTLDIDSDEVEGVKWDAWNRVLAGIAGIIAVGGRKDSDALTRTYQVAVELRERLRYSQGRLRSLKNELAVTVAAARSERHEAMARLQELETEVARLAGAVQAQGSTLAARETVSHSQAAENEQLRRHIAALERQLQRAEEDRRVTVSERNDALRHLDKVTTLLEESERRVAEVQSEHNGLLGELVTTKARLADMFALETMYGAARDELQRLDKENTELKDMVTTGGVALGRSRILEALGIPEGSGAGGVERGAGAVGRRGGAGKRPGSPALLGYGGGGGGGSPSGGGGGGGGGRSRSAPRARRTASSLPAGSTSGPLSPAAGVLQLPSGAASSSATPSLSPSAAPSASAPSLEDPVSEMAFLGPPSAAYPPDPDTYQFYRVGGGYEARLNPAQPTIPQPRASGWVPKDVVRLVQAFRRSYGLPLEWRYWEPLVLMVDEVYRSRADGTLAAMKAAQQEKLKAIKRQVRGALGYPNVVANEKINHLQRQLNNARKTLALTDRKGEQNLRAMVLKDYNLGHQLDRALEENYALRRSLEDMYTVGEVSSRGNGAAAAASRGNGEGDGGLERRPSPPAAPAAAADAMSPAAAAAVAAAAAALRASSTSDLYGTSPPPLLSVPRLSPATSALSPRRLMELEQQQQQLQQLQQLHLSDRYDAGAAVRRGQQSLAHAHSSQSQSPSQHQQQQQQRSTARPSQLSAAAAEAAAAEELWAQRRTIPTSSHLYSNQGSDSRNPHQHIYQLQHRHPNHQHLQGRNSEATTTYSRRTSVMSAAPGGRESALVDAFGLAASS